MQKTKCIVSLLLALTLLLTLTSCLTESVPATGFRITTAPFILEPGTTHQIQYEFTPSNTTNKNITWSSNNIWVANVNSGGLVTAIAPAPGQIRTDVIIAARTHSGSFVDSVVVTVGPREIPVTSITLNPTQATLNVGETLTIGFTILPAEADDKHITWTSDDPSKVSIAQNGIATAMAYGTATITATTRSGGHTATCVITVTSDHVAVTGVTVNPTSLNMSVGNTSTLQETVLPNNASNKNVTWHTSNGAVASVNTNGLVTAIAPGNATITVRTQEGGFEANCNVTVTPSGNEGVLPPPDWMDLVAYRHVEIFWEQVNFRWEYWIIYNSTTPMNNTSVVLRVNNQAVVEQGVELSPDNREWFSYGYIPATLPGGANADVQLTTPEGVSNISLSVPHLPLISNTVPPTFNPTQDFRINWTLSSNADMQWIDFYAGTPGQNPLDFDLYLVFLRNDIRTHNIAANSFSSNQTQYEFWVVNFSDSVDRNTLFLISREDYRGNLARSMRIGNQHRRNRFIKMREAFFNNQLVN